VPLDTPCSVAFVLYGENFFIVIYYENCTQPQKRRLKTTNKHIKTLYHNETSLYYYGASSLRRPVNKMASAECEINSEFDMNWIHPWIVFDWIRFDSVGLGQDFQGTLWIGLDWIGLDCVGNYSITNYDL